MGGAAAPGQGMRLKGKDEDGVKVGRSGEVVGHHRLTWAR